MSSVLCKFFCIGKERKSQRYAGARGELKEMIRTKTFVSIAKEFGVSDNAIRKWCDKYGLPRKKTDIDKYTDEEWENI